MISPALYMLCKKHKKISVFVLTQLLLMSLVFYGEIKNTSITYWIPVHGAGLWTGIYIPNYVLECNKKSKYNFISCIVFFAFTYTLYAFLIINHILIILHNVLQAEQIEKRNPNNIACYLRQIKL